MEIDKKVEVIEYKNKNVAELAYRKTVPVSDKS